MSRMNVKESPERSWNNSDIEEDISGDEFHDGMKIIWTSVKAQTIELFSGFRGRMSFCCCSIMRF